MKKKTSLFTLLAAYVLLLFALTAAEAPHPNSGIRSIGDALWYSLVTITTVGYGDLYPVSPAGKIIGVFFLLLSVGALAFAVSFVYAALTGSFLPRAKLLSNRRKPWFIFSDMNDASAALAADIARTQQSALLVFCGSGNPPKKDLPAVHVMQGVQEVLPLCAGNAAVFFISGDPLKNAEDACAIGSMTHPTAQVFCMSRENNSIPGVSFFDPFTCCARAYWQAHPIAPGEKNILVVGSGHYAHALVSQALIANCRAPFAASSYHLFGDWDEYRRSHPLLCRAYEAAKASDTQDALCFHNTPWNDDIALIEAADRILFCADDERENARLAIQLDRLYAHCKNVHVRCASPAVPGMRFGLPQELYTAETVMKHALDGAARAMHETYRRSADYPVPAWEELSGFTKASNRAVADHMLTKLRLLLPDEDVRAITPGACRRAYDAYLAGGAPLRDLCRENEHERWTRFHLLYNWQYAPARDNGMRRHPSLVPFADLSETEKAKDDTAWTQLESIAQSES